MRRSPSADTRLLPEADQFEQPSCPMAVGVLVEHAFARAPTELFRLGRVREQVAVRVDGGVRAPCDAEIDARARDRAREDVERDVADEARVADVALEVTAAEREV